MQSYDGPGCGRAQHADDCLCDVQIVNEVRIITEGTKFDKAIARAIGWGAGDATALDYYEALARAKDVQAATADMLDVVPFDRRDDIIAMLRAGESITDVPTILGDALPGVPYTLSIVVQILSVNRASRMWLWSPSRWLLFEATLMDPNMEPLREAEWVGYFECGRSALQAAEGWYGRSLPRVTDGKLPLKAAILMQPWESTPAAVVRALRDEYPGVSANRVADARYDARIGKPIRCPDALRHLLKVPSRGRTVEVA